MFDRAEFDAEMERLKKIPCLMNEEWVLSEAMDKAATDDGAAVTNTDATA